ncbi:MAG: hypothetical protein QM783_07920 [Phycisphaerales bacterium]
MPESSPGEHPQHLCPRSREAVDAMVENGFEVDALAPDHKQRCANLKTLLDKLKSHPVPCCCADESVHRTMARIAAANNTTRYELSEADADALELLVAHGWDVRKVPSAVRPALSTRLRCWPCSTPQTPSRRPPTAWSFRRSKRFHKSLHARRFACASTSRPRRAVRCGWPTWARSPRC